MRTLCLLALLLCLTSYTRGQDAPTTVWKTKVSRDIDIRDEYTGKLSGSTPDDSTLSKKIINALMTKKVAAYQPSGTPSKMSAQEVEDALFGRLDTFGAAPNYVSGYDPETAIKHRFDPYTFYKYRVYEEWNYNPSEGRMSGQIAFIAPVNKIYGDDGIDRGSEPTAKVKYDDFVSLLYNKDDSGIYFSLHSNVWKSYFIMDSGEAIKHSAIPSGVWHATATATIDMQEPVDTQKHFLRNENDVPLLSELIITEVKNKELQAWSAEDEPFSRRLTKSKLDKLLADKIDTTVIADSITKTEITRYVRMPVDYTTIQYRILEDWAYDPMTGKTEIVIKGVAPVRITVNDRGRVTETKTMFWIHFADFAENPQQGRTIPSRKYIYHASLGELLYG